MIRISPELRSQLGVQLAFDGAVLKVAPDQFERWRRSFRKIPDLCAALQVADDYYQENPAPDGKYLARCSRWLERRNDDWAEWTEKRLRDQGRIW